MFDKFTRWNADHSICTLVRFDEDPDNFAFLTQDFNVLVTNEDMARIFRVPLSTEDAVRSAINSTNVNQMFFIQFDGERFALLGEEPKDHFVGIIDVCEEVRNRSQRLQLLNRLFHSEYAKALVEGTVYEAFLYEGDNIVDSCRGFIDLQEAATFFNEATPECQYSDCDFVKNGIDFELKPEAHNCPPDSELIEVMQNVGFKLYTQEKRLASLFGVSISSQEDNENAEYEAEELTGNVVLWIAKTHDAVIVSKEPSELRGEGEDIGMLVFSRSSWTRHFPRTPYVPSVVQAIMQELIEYRLWYTICLKN